MSQLVLPEKAVERNLEHFRKYKTEGNPLVERVYRGETTFSDETKDLFYFFHGFGQYFSRLVKPPEFREKHDERAGELVDVLNGLDLMTPDDEKDLERQKRDLKKRNYENPQTERVLSENIEIIYPQIRGDRNIEGRTLSREMLEEHFKRRRFLEQLTTGVPLALGSALLTYGFVHSYPNSFFPPKIIGACILAIDGAIILSNLMLSRPPDYHALDTKVCRADQFIKQHKSEI